VPACEQCSSHHTGADANASGQWMARRVNADAESKYAASSLEAMRSSGQWRAGGGRSKSARAGPGTEVARRLHRGAIVQLVGAACGRLFGRAGAKQAVGKQWQGGVGAGVSIGYISKVCPSGRLYPGVQPGLCKPPPRKRNAEPHWAERPGRAVRPRRGSSGAGTPQACKGNGARGLSTPPGPRLSSPMGGSHRWWRAGLGR
jgi:hypothetical protein